MKQEEFNNYASQKSISQKLLNISSIQFHIGILINTFVNYPKLEGLHVSLITLVIFILIIETVIFVMITWLFYANINENYWTPIRPMYINSIVTILSGVSMIINISITIILTNLG